VTAGSSALCNRGAAERCAQPGGAALTPGGARLSNCGRGEPLRRVESSAGIARSCGAAHGSFCRRTETRWVFAPRRGDGPERWAGMERDLPAGRRTAASRPAAIPPERR